LHSFPPTRRVYLRRGSHWHNTSDIFGPHRRDESLLGLVRRTALRSGETEGTILKDDT